LKIIVQQAHKAQTRNVCSRKYGKFKFFFLIFDFFIDISIEFWLFINKKESRVKNNLILSIIGLIITFATPVEASITAVAGGPDAPATLLGPYTMTPFLPDLQLTGYTAVTAVLSPLGGQISFGLPVLHAYTPSEWATWSNEYIGDVYYTGGATVLTMTLPAFTSAFYFYVEPKPLSIYNVIAIAQDGTNITQAVKGYAGACYFGFYGTDGSTINALAVAVLQNPVDFAVGQFGISRIPSPDSILLCAIGTIVIVWLSRYKLL
jgi:hypothetical protein